MAINKPTLLSREEYLKKKRKKITTKYSLLFLTLLVLTGFLSYGAHRKEVRISEVVLTGGILVTEKDISEESLNLISGSFFWLFPRNNSFLYSKKYLEENLMSKFRRIETINISLEGLNKMVVDITERKPIAVWCDKLPGSKKVKIGSGVAGVTLATTTIQSENEPIQEELTSKDSNPKCYFIDLHSTIFAEAPDFSGDAYFKYYGLVESANPIGQKFIASSTQFTKINNFIDSVKKLKLKPLYLRVKGEDEFALVIHGGGEIFFDSKKSLSLAFDNLETLLSSSELSFGIRESPSIDYIDLRYGNKLFYKLRTQ